ncbi:MAG: hypothetical protein MKZ98_11925, partial [Pseudomonadales bacterium]|nr:hypothetical protein [Pseudomonadales bacterium]
QTPNTKHQTPNTKHQTPNTKHQTPNIAIMTLLRGQFLTPLTLINTHHGENEFAPFVRYRNGRPTKL